MSHPAIKYAVHDRLMTVQEVAAEMGVSRQSISRYRYRHPTPDGTPLSLQDTYDRYCAARRKGRRRCSGGGRYPMKFQLDGQELTVAEATRALGVSRVTLYRRLAARDGNLERVRSDLDQRRRKIAVREILSIIKGD